MIILINPIIGYKSCAPIFLQRPCVRWLLLLCCRPNFLAGADFIIKYFSSPRRRTNFLRQQLWLSLSAGRARPRNVMVLKIAFLCDLSFLLASFCPAAALCFPSSAGDIKYSLHIIMLTTTGIASAAKTALARRAASVYRRAGRQSQPSELQRERKIKLNYANRPSATS